jgi:hypothetical protein
MGKILSGYIQPREFEPLFCFIFDTLGFYTHSSIYIQSHSNENTAPTALCQYSAHTQSRAQNSFWRKVISFPGKLAFIYVILRLKSILFLSKILRSPVRRMCDEKL